MKKGIWISASRVNALSCKTEPGHEAMKLHYHSGVWSIIFHHIGSLCSAWIKRGYVKIALKQLDSVRLVGCRQIVYILYCNNEVPIRLHYVELPRDH